MHPTLAGEESTHFTFWFWQLFSHFTFKQRLINCLTLSSQACHSVVWNSMHILTRKDFCC